MARQTSLFPKQPPSLKLIKGEIDRLSADLNAKTGLRLIFSALGLVLMLIAVFWHKLPPEIPLFYSYPYGEQQLAIKWSIWLIPISVLILEFLAIRAAGATMAQDKLLAQILVWSGAVIALMTLITVTKAILLIT